MTDWPRVAANALWIIGCALILAALSYTNWLAHRRGVRTRKLLNTPIFQLPYTGGLCLISSGLFLLSHGWLEHGLWAAFVIVFAWQLWRLWKSQRSL